MFGPDSEEMIGNGNIGLSHWQSDCQYLLFLLNEEAVVFSGARRSWNVFENA
jgi:hypothetical protein